jgi:uncharacterized membrane protein
MRPFPKEKEVSVQGLFRGRLKRNFLTGILVLVPIVGTIFLFVWAFTKITGNGLAVLRRWDYFEMLYAQHKTGYEIIGRLIVLFVLFAVISIIGFFTRNFIGNKAIRLTEKIFENIPLINRIFLALKQLSQAVISSERSLFSYVVLFEYPRKGIYSIGFVMSESRGEVQAKTKEEVLSVFLPTTPNPTSGLFMMVPKKDAIRLAMGVEDALKMIISGGAVTPRYVERELGEQRPADTPEAGASGEQSTHYDRSSSMEKPQ